MLRQTTESKEKTHREFMGKVGSRETGDEVDLDRFGTTRTSDQPFWISPIRQRHHQPPLLRDMVVARE